MLPRRVRFGKLVIEHYGELHLHAWDITEADHCVKGTIGPKPIFHSVEASRQRREGYQPKAAPWVSSAVEFRPP